MFRHRTAVGRTQGTIARRHARRLLTALTATAVALALVPFAAPSASAATYTITGTVTGLSATGAVVPVPDAGIWVYDASNRYVSGAGPSSDGTYTVTLPTGGPYRIQAGCWGTMACAPSYGMEWYANAADFDTATPVTIASTTTPARADIRLDRRSTITGTVRNAAGQPVASSVEVSPASGGEVLTATPDALGNFTIAGVPAGRSYLTAQDTSGNHLYDSAYWNGTTSTTAYSSYTVPAGASVTGVNLVLAPATGVLGIATDTAGNRLQNIGWNLFEYRPAEGDWYGVQAGPLLTNADGEMWWRTQVGKTYKLCFYDSWHDTDWNPTDRYADRCWSSSDPTGSPTLETASPITPTDTTRRQVLTVQLPYAGKALSPVEPFVTGSPTVGGTLTVDAGRWSPAGVALSYQWYSSTPAGRTAIAGATGPSYVPTSAVSGATLSVAVTGTLAGYKTVSETAYANVVGAPTPTLTSPLTLTGSAVVGGTLTASHGAITPAGDYYTSYTWVIDGVPGETMWDSAPPSITLTSAHVGKRIGLRMLASGGPANQLQVSALSAVVQGGTLTAPTPTVTGTAKVGSTLTAVPGTWGPSPVTLAYQWYAAGTAISGATAGTYVPTSTTLGKVITVSVTGTKPGYPTTTRTSAATAAVVAGTLTAPTPTISGTKAVGSTLTAVPGAWGPSPVTLTYQWYRSGVAISGATASTYRLTTTDQTKTMTVRVTGTKAGYTTAARTSAATTAVLGALTAPTPTISGTKAVGSTLTAVPGAWGPSPVTLTYQWYRSGVAISGATASTYRLTTTDQTRTMTVKVTGAKAGYLTTARTSAATTAVLGVFTTPTPTISGTRKVTYTLTAIVGTWSPVATTYTYQWYRSGVAISGATAKTYKLVTLDKGKVIKVRVTGVKTGYLTRSVYSAQTATIA